MKLEVVCQAADENKHNQDIESVIIFNGRVFTGADDGKIKIWSTKDLSLLHEFQAHEYAVYHLLIFEDRLYSGSIDQTIKSWQIDTWKHVVTFTGHEEAPRRLATDGEYIYSGDDKGDVMKWSKDGDLVGVYDVIEEVWDLHVKDTLIYSVRDRGLTISELQWTKDKNKQNRVVCVLEGRAPMYVTSDNIFVINSSGMSIIRYTNTPPKCEVRLEYKGHEKIITTLTGWGNYVVSGGWDSKAIIWNTISGSIEASALLPECPSSIAAAGDGQVFVGGANGYLVKLKAS